jgi:hypothetical protein
MTHIQMTDGNSSDSGLTEELANEELANEELTNEELSAIDGGGIGALTGAAGGAATSILTNTINREPINWRSAGIGGLVGGGMGAIRGATGGIVGASLAGED